MLNFDGIEHIVATPAPITRRETPARVIAQLLAIPVGSALPMRSSDIAEHKSNQRSVNALVKRIRQNWNEDEAEPVFVTRTIKSDDGLTLGVYRVA